MELFVKIVKGLQPLTMFSKSSILAIGLSSKLASETCFFRYSFLQTFLLAVVKMLKFRNSSPEVFLGKGVLKTCSKFIREHPCRSAISMKLQSTLRHGSSPVNLLHIFRMPFPKNTSEWLLL